MRAVDTNVIVRLIMRDDFRQVESAERFIEQGAWVPALALTEAAWVLATVYRLHREALATSIEMLLDHRNLVVQDSEIMAAALAMFRTRPALGFSDCLMLQTARKAGHLPLGTFDRIPARVEGTQKL
jgi:predicted nucleic-acid-binding protein